MIAASTALPAEIWEDFQAIQISGTQLPDNLFETGSHEVRGSISLGSTNLFSRLGHPSWMP
jgi:hypothetical protein